MSDLVSIGFTANTTGITKAGTELDKLTVKGATTDKTVRTLDTSFNSLRSTASALGITFAALGVSMASREIIQYSDQWKNVNSQLRQVTASESDLIVVRRELLSLSKETRSELTNTVDLYSQITRSTKDLGVSSAEVMGITRTLNNLFVAGGKPISEVNGAIRQLTQGFAAGALRGDEFNSVAEGAPKIMDALGKALNMTRGELRDFAATGGITAEIMVSALQDYNAEAQKMADQTEKTFGQNMINASTNTIAFVGSLEGLNRAIGTIGDGIESTTDDLEEYSDKVEAWINNFAGISSDIDNILAQSSSKFSLELLALGVVTEETLKVLSGAILQFPLNIRAMTQILAVELASAVDIARASSNAFGVAIGVGLGVMVDTAYIRVVEFGKVMYEELGLVVEKIKIYSAAIADAMNPFADSAPNVFFLAEAAEEATKRATDAIREGANAQIEIYNGVASSMTDKSFATAEAQIAASRDARLAVISDSIAQRDMAIASYDDIIAKIEAVKESQGVSSSSSVSAPSISMGDNSDDIGDLIDQVDKFGDSWSNAGDSIAQAMGDIVGGLDSYSSKMSSILSLESKLREERGLATTTAEDKLRIDKSLADLDKQATSTQLSGMAQISGAASSLFAEQSKEREALHKMEQVYTAIEIGLAMQKAGANALAAITSSFAAPFPVNFAAGAAMIGIMAGLGVFSGGSSSSAPTAEELQADQGTGTILGDSEAKSESILNALEMYNEIGTDQLSELVQIKNSMSGLTDGIASLAVSLISSSSFAGANAEGLGTTKALKGYITEFHAIGAFLGDPLGELLDGIIGNFKKTTRKLLDSGIVFDAQSIGDLIAEGAMDASYYAVLETTKRSFWGAIKNTSEDTELTQIEGAISDEFVAIFGYLGDTVTGALDSLGLEATNALEGFEIDLGSLSFEGLSGDEIQAELEAIFSAQGDLIAEYMLPAISEFQEMGEGALETLVRVAQEQAVFNDAIDTLGLSLSSLSTMIQIDVTQSVLNLMGGLEEFSESTSSYIDSFYTDAEKLDILESSISDVFASLGEPMVDTIDGFRELVAGLDLTTSQGQEMFATLMLLNPAMAEYIDMLDAQEEAIRELASDAYDDLVLAVEAEQARVDAVLAGAEELYAAEIERIAGVSDALEETFDMLTDNVNNAKDALTSSFQAEQQLVADASALKIAGIQAEIAASTEYHNTELEFISSLQDATNTMISGLGSASTNLRSVVEVDTNALSSDLAEALAAAQGGNFAKAIALGDISSLIQDSSTFSSAQQMNASNATTTFRANELADLVDTQLSIEEKTLLAIEAQSDAEYLRYENEQAALSEMVTSEELRANAEIAALEAQMNSLLGIDTTTLSIDASINALHAAEIELSELDYQRQLEILSQEEVWAMEALEQAENAAEEQTEALDNILTAGAAQVDALYNINTSVLSVVDAISQLQNAVSNAEAAQASRDLQIAKNTNQSTNYMRQLVIDTNEVSA